MATTPFTLIDTNAVPWEDNPGIPGFKRQLLTHDEATSAQIRVDYVPPGIVPAGLQLPHRHYHNSVTERAYTLFGDFPHWEFSGVRDDEGELIMFRRHLFMDRPPKSIHGLMPEPISATGAAGWKVKPLAKAVKHSGSVCLVHIPADWTAPGEPLGVSGSETPPWLFVVSGDLCLHMAENGARHDLGLREGGFLLWRTGAALGVPHESATDGGCVVLCIGHDLSESGEH